MTAAPVRLFSTGHDATVEQVVLDVLRSSQIASGSSVDAFRAALARVIGNDAVATTADMSAAMSIALRLAGIAPGDEVIASPFACLSTNAPIALSGARIRWVDVDPRTGGLDPDDVRQAINGRTRAVVLYHLAGYPGPAAELARLCRDEGIALIEDCDNALGATRHGRHVGLEGDHAIFSFYPNRQVNGLEGGAVASRDPADAARAARLRRFGIDAARFRDRSGEIAEDADVPEIGWSASMNNLNAAAALVQIGRLDERLAATRRNARRLEETLGALPGFRPLAALDGAEPAYWGLMLRHDRSDDLLAALKNAGILASRLHQRNDRYSGMPADRRRLAGVDEIERTALAIPCGWWLGSEDLRRIEETAATFAR